MMVPQIALECASCPETKGLEIVSLVKPGGAVVSPRGQMAVELGHATLCAGCRTRLERRGYQVTVMPKGVDA